MQMNNGGRTQTLEPIVTGASVLAVKYKDGVMVAADTLGSYGSLARFMHMERIKPVGMHTIVAASGEMSDFQQIMTYLEELVRNDVCIDDGFMIQSRELWNYLNRILYNRRSRVDPLWNDLIMIGWNAGKPFLGALDKLGTAFEDNYAATGYGMYLALPLLRAGWREDLTHDQAKALIEACMTVLVLRDARALNHIQIGTVTQEGVEVSKPYELNTQGRWDCGEVAIHDTAI
eukprot:TRINITY_DN1887_c0_g1_i1.p1 TRINITY_DN1887_c0_g1~~TRINITY_DN1887_c0_g1_i1.p1  ORF type:complete len:256 (-),score=61.20 TRINITY_DN1887_c0_g1_i1:60-755(-)